jgi:hypothetical protein
MGGCWEWLIGKDVEQIDLSIFQNYTGGQKKKPSASISYCRPRIEVGTSRIRSRGVNHQTLSFSVKSIVTIWGCDYRRGVDCWMGLLTTYTHHSYLHFTDHWHTWTSALSPLQFPLAVAWQQLLTAEVPQLSALTSLLSSGYPATEFLSTVNSAIAPSLLSLPRRTLLNCQPSTNCVPGWRPFHTSLLVISSQVDFQLTTELCHSPTNYFT